MSDVTITHNVVGQGGKYTAKPADSDVTGYLEWEPQTAHGGDEVRIATHTIVPKEIGGRGIAAELVKRLVSDAREQGFKIVPRCSYVERMFERHPEWSDLKA